MSLNSFSQWAGCGPGGKAPGGVFGAGKARIIGLCVSAVVFLVLGLAGCVSDEVSDTGGLGGYQRILARLGSRNRQDDEGADSQRPLSLLRPTEREALSSLGTIGTRRDPNTGRLVMELEVEQAVVKALANSPEIRVVGFEPAMARQEITKEAAEFDPAVFNRLTIEQQDEPANSTLEANRSDNRSLEAGVKQKGITGAEWSLGYVLSRNWDNLLTRARPTRYEPILAFQLRQPLLRDGWQRTNLAGVNIARLNHRISLLGFREKAEELSTQVIAAYWLLLQARRDFSIQQSLLDTTVATYNKVVGRKEIDATDVQIRQAEAAVKTREALLLRARKRVVDAQDALLRLIADPQANLLSESEVIPVTPPHLAVERLDVEETLKEAMRKNPAIERARVALEIAQINIDVAENQAMPRLDLVGSARAEGLSRGSGQALDRLHSGDHLSYEVGLALEYPIGNRQRKAELVRRQIERRQAVVMLQNVADQVAEQVKERIRKVETSFAEIHVQEEASNAAQIHLQALEEAERIREKLTPEFLLVKLQAQQILAEAQRAEIEAIVNFNIAAAQLAQVVGNVLELHPVDKAIDSISRVSSTGQGAGG